jgi:hypothetical protein
MQRKLLLGVVLARALSAAPAFARSGSWDYHSSYSYHSNGNGSYSSSGYRAHSSRYCYFCVRDSHGRIARSAEAREEFMRETGYPHGRPGYVIDHIVPLKRGGADAPYNMQWQTREEARAKDKWE